MACNAFRALQLLGACRLGQVMVPKQLAIIAGAPPRTSRSGWGDDRCRNHRLKVSPGSLGLSLASLKFSWLSPSNVTCPTIAGVLPCLRINRLSAKV